MDFSKMTGTVHIIGAGLAGLSAAVCLIQRGASVVVHDAAGHGGGRCRSYYDEALGCRIDNGNHLMLSGNHAILDYLKTIGSEDTLVRSDEAEFPFLDLSTGLFRGLCFQLTRGCLEARLVNICVAYR
jgi:phytoene dehydrogenase-like protein